MHEELVRDVLAVKPLGGYRVHLRFDDGVSGDCDLRPVIGSFEGVFAPFADAAYVSQVSVNHDTGTICWPSGADIDPVVLYCAVRGIAVPDFRPPARAVPKRPGRSTRKASGARATAKGRRKAGG